MEAATTIRLSEIENIVGVKEASGNLDQITKVIQGVGPDFRVWSGNDSDTLPILALGGYGVVSVASHLCGLQVKSMIDLFLSGETAHAAAIHARLLPLVNALFIMANPIPVKYLLNQVGFSVGAPRLPLVEPDEKTAAQLREAVAGHRIDLPVPASLVRRPIPAYPCAYQQAGSPKRLAGRERSSERAGKPDQLTCAISSTAALLTRAAAPGR